MTFSASLLLLVAMPLSEAEGERPAEFDNYTKGYRAAQAVRRPMLVILNPPAESGTTPILLDDVRRTQERRELLDDYIVVVLDTGTDHGQVCHKLFGSPELPRVVVIDKWQKYSIFKTSGQLYGQLWTDILKKYRNGERPTPVQPASWSSAVAWPSGGYRSYPSLSGVPCRT